MEIHGNSCEFMGLHGSSWVFMRLHVNFGSFFPFFTLPICQLSIGAFAQLSSPKIHTGPCL